jgi:hypothetical protein
MQIVPEVPEIPSPKITRANWTGGVAQSVEYLLCKCEALSSNASPTKKNKKKKRKATRNWWEREEATARRKAANKGEQINAMWVTGFDPSTTLWRIVQHISELSCPRGKRAKLTCVLGRLIPCSSDLPRT